MIKHSEYLKLRKDAVLENGSMSPEMFDFYIGLFQEQEEFSSRIGDISIYINNLKKDSFPVLDPEGIVIDEEMKSLLFDLMVKLTDGIAKVNTGMDFSFLKESFKKDMDALISAFLKQDFTFMEKKGIENRLAIDEFIFVIHNIFKPFITYLAKNSESKPDKEDWLENFCPFCGYLPDMSKIVESKENKRHMHCALCENEWEFPRLICPACGCSDQKKHGFFEYEDNNLYRVYYCDECKHYIKSVRIPKLKEESSFDLAVEDIITSFLDSAMIEKGYQRI